MLAEQAVLQEIESEALTMFKAGHRAEKTLDHNQRFLNYFLRNFLKMSHQEFVDKTRQDLKWGEAKIAAYFITIKARVAKKEIESDSVHNFRDPIKVLCDMNDLELNWKRLDKILPARRRKTFKGVAAPKETLRTLCSYPDRRIKSIVTTITSAGLRNGAWDHFTVGDLEPAYLKGKLVEGKLTVYRNEPEEYPTRISLEAYNFWLRYFEERRQAGETITPESPLLRDLWAGDRAAKGLAKFPKKLASNGVKRLLEDAWASFPNLRTKKPGAKKFDIKATHFGRKYFETACLKAGIEPWQIKIFRGDILPTDLGYEGFTEEELTEIHLKADSELTIFEPPVVVQSEDVESLKKEITATKADLAMVVEELRELRKLAEESVKRQLSQE